MGRAFNLSFYLECGCDIWKQSSYFVTMKTSLYFKETKEPWGTGGILELTFVFLIVTKTEALEDTKSDYTFITCR